MTLDELLAEEGLDSVSVIKLDVDGFESFVFAGATQTLMKDAPAIVMEVGAAMDALSMALSSTLKYGVNALKAATTSSATGGSAQHMN